MSSNAKTITVLYFAAMREAAGRDEETRTTHVANAADLFAEIAADYAVDLPQSRLRVAVNHTFCPWNQALKAGDTVAFIPPVAGG